MLLHTRNQKYKRLNIKNGQNDRSGNSSVNAWETVNSNPRLNQRFFRAVQRLT